MFAISCLIGMISLQLVQSDWEVSAGPAFKGQYGVASDPTVVALDNKLRMYYTGLNPRNSRTVLCVAESDDGFAWSNVDTDSWIKGKILEGRNDKWDENLESAFVLENEDKYLMYFSGYRDKGDPVKGFPAALGLATSDDGLTFKRYQDQPLLEPTPDGYDSHAIYSPVVVKHNKMFYMVYCGHSYSGRRAGVRILGATSKDGINWAKMKKPILQTSDVGDWARDGVAEPALLKMGDDSWRLYFTSLDGEKRLIGVSKGASPHGPWEVATDPIIQPNEKSFANHLVLAPTLLLEKDRIRMWLLGTNAGSETIQIGHAQRLLDKE